MWEGGREGRWGGGKMSLLYWIMRRMKRNGKRERKTGLNIYSPLHLPLKRRQKAWNIFCLELILTRDEQHVIVTSVICLKVERNRLVLLHQPSTSVSVSSHSQCLKLQKVLNYSWQWNLASWAHIALPLVPACSACVLPESCTLLWRRKLLGEVWGAVVPPHTANHSIYVFTIWNRWLMQHTATLISSRLSPFLCTSFYPASFCHTHITSTSHRITEWFLLEGTLKII